MSTIEAIARWSHWAGELSSRHRRHAVRSEGLSLVLAQRQAASRTVRERWLLSSRSVLPQIHLAIQPLLRFDLRTAAEASRVLRQVIHERERRHTDYHGLFTDRFRQSDSTRERVAALLQPASETPRIAPLSLVLQRLREPESVLAVRAERGAQSGPAARPSAARRLATKLRRQEKLAGAPAALVLREEMPALLSERDVAGAAPGFSTMPRAASDSWREAPAEVSLPSVEDLTEKVMRQIDHRLHAWRERKGGF